MLQIFTNWWLGYTPDDLKSAKDKLFRKEPLTNTELHAIRSDFCDDLSGVRSP